MATEPQARIVEDAIDYTFQSQRPLLLRALTAAGAVEEDWDGNRRLAQLGTALTDTSDFKCKLSSSKQRMVVAERSGIDKCIKYSEKAGARSPSVIGKAVNAIIGAVYLDCGKDITIVLGVMQRLSMFTPCDNTIDPAMLSLSHVPRIPDITSFGNPLLGGEIDTTSSITPSEQSLSPIFPALMHSIKEGIATEGAHAREMLSTEHDEEQTLHRNVPDEYFNPDMFFNNSLPRESRHTDLGVDSQEGPTPEIADDVQEHGRQKRKSPLAFRAVGKKKSLQRRDSQIGDDTIGKYLSEEVKKCEAVGCRPPEETFFTPAVQEAALILGKGKVDTLTKILVSIASPHSIATLQEILEKSRSESDHTMLHSGNTLSKAQRFCLISRLDGIISYYQLLRRHHILELFRECGGSKTLLGNGLVLTTPRNFGDALNKRGNPMNKAEADVTAKMMEEIFPEVRTGSDGHKAKYRMMTYLRRLGQRLNTLEMQFGNGILGLILDHGFTGQMNMGISDKMIMCLTDPEFKRFTMLLDTSQGDILRKFGVAVSPIIEALTVGELPPHKSFNLERVQLGDILKHPKGAPGLLDLISETYEDSAAMHQQI
ncbi:hypothetical protein P154DRAFT_586024 [Amniculicola lignicola CBS 123094]|uniref:RNase III domain-containing protein n=1 Tax=Amniculicola lignicola CBS 123094 TaxID=1392246 RepID=A0A6A5W5C2_9PLEO|nr:hypothetical protein P154DRAFT_586024 [Amniculicola lignicola CBS 123094]